MAMLHWLERLEYRSDWPAVTPWGESTALWSEVDWAWYRAGCPVAQPPPRES